MREPRRTPTSSACTMWWISLSHPNGVVASGTAPRRCSAPNCRRQRTSQWCTCADLRRCTRRSADPKGRLRTRRHKASWVGFVAVAVYEGLNRASVIAFVIHHQSAIVVVRSSSRASRFAALLFGAGVDSQLGFLRFRPRRREDRENEDEGNEDSQRLLGRSPVWIAHDLIGCALCRLVSFWSAFGGLACCGTPGPFGRGGLDLVELNSSGVAVVDLRGNRHFCRDIAL